MAEFCHSDIKRRLEQHILFSDKALQKVFCLCCKLQNRSGGQSLLLTDSLAFSCISVCLASKTFVAKIPDHSAKLLSALFLPYDVIRFDLCGLEIVPADFLCEKMNAVLIKYLSLLHGIEPPYAQTLLHKQSALKRSSPERYTGAS